MVGDGLLFGFYMCTRRFAFLGWVRLVADGIATIEAIAIICIYSCFFVGNSGLTGARRYFGGLFFLGGMRCVVVHFVNLVVERTHEPCVPTVGFFCFLGGCVFRLFFVILWLLF